MSVICLYQALPVEWMMPKKGLAQARTMKSVMISFMCPAPRLPQTLATRGLSSGSPSARRAASLSAFRNSPLTGVPVTTTRSGCL